MVFVKVRETYDLCTTQNKMTVIGVHTPMPSIIKKNFPGLLMQCKAYRPYSCDVRIACASVLPLDPLGVGTTAGSVAPEDMFNPILYKATTNKGMSQLEARIQALSRNQDASITLDVNGASAAVEVNETTNASDEFGIYYGLLSNAHGWRHAMPQSGLSMSSLRPLVNEILYNVTDQVAAFTSGEPTEAFPKADGNRSTFGGQAIVGDSKPMPFINCTAYNITGQTAAGFSDAPVNVEQDVPWIDVMVAAIIVPPSKLHQLFYRMVVEWTIEFTKIRPIGEIISLNGLGSLSTSTHYQNYSYSSTKDAVLDGESVFDNESSMVDANVDIKKVM